MKMCVERKKTKNRLIFLITKSGESPQIRNAYSTTLNTDYIFRIDNVT